jgi:hypothetical protein
MKAIKESDAVNVVSRSMGVEWKRGGFKKAVLSAVAERCAEIGTSAIEEALRVTRPDAYYIDHENEVVCCLEIEHTSRMQPKHFFNYEELLWVLDEAYWSFDLWSANGFGLDPHPVSIIGMASQIRNHGSDQQKQRRAS